MYRSSDYEEAFVFSRLFIYVQVLIFPAYFLLIGGILTETIDLPIIENEWISTFITSWIGPILFAIPFMVWTIKRRYQLASAYELMGGRIKSLPVAIRVFYGFNFVIVLIFILPFVAPIVSVFGGYWLSLMLVNRNNNETVGFKESTIVKIFTILFGIVTAFFAVAFYVQIVPFFDKFYIIWTDNLSDIYGLSVALADAVAIGGILYFYFERNSFDQDEIPEWRIFFIDFIIFCAFAGIFVLSGGTAGNSPFVAQIHIVAVLVSGILLVLRIIYGMTDTSGSSIKAWLLILIFQGINFASGELSLVTKTTAVFIAFILFTTLFISAYQEAKRRY